MQVRRVPSETCEASFNMRSMVGLGTGPVPMVVPTYYWFRSRQNFHALRASAMARREFLKSPPYSGEAETHTKLHTKYTELYRVLPACLTFHLLAFVRFAFFFFSVRARDTSKQGCAHVHTPRPYLTYVLLRHEFVWHRN